MTRLQGQLILMKNLLQTKVINHVSIDEHKEEAFQKSTKQHKNLKYP